MFRLHTLVLTINIITMRKFQHYAVKTVLIGLTALFAFGFVNIVYHLAFNNPTITFGGW